MNFFPFCFVGRNLFNLITFHLLLSVPVVCSRFRFHFAQVPIDENICFVYIRDDLFECHYLDFNLNS